MSGKPGQPRVWRPTERERGNVEGMAACGITEDRIAAVLGISPHTLRKHCRAELDTAMTRAHALVGNWILASILGRESVPNRITDERARAALAIFYAKTKMQWSERIEIDATITGDTATMSDAELEYVARGRNRAIAAPAAKKALPRLVH